MDGVPILGVFFNSTLLAFLQHHISAHIGTCNGNKTVTVGRCGVENRVTEGCLLFIHRSAGRVVFRKMARSRHVAKRRDNRIQQVR